MNNYVVFLPVFDRRTGLRVATHRQCVATEARAQQIAAGHPSRSYRPLTHAERMADDAARRTALAKATEPAHEQSSYRRIAVPLAVTAALAAGLAGYLFR